MTAVAVKDEELKKAVEKVNWNLEYGTVTVQVRDGKPTLIKIERTIKLD